MIKWLIKCLPRRSRASDMDGLKPESIADILKRAPKGNMTPEEVYYVFDYDDDKPWLWKEWEFSRVAMVKRPRGCGYHG